MRTAQDRITELTSRQRYDGSSMVVELHSIKGYFHYGVYVNIETGETKMLPWVYYWKLKHDKNNFTEKIEVPPDAYSGEMVEASISNQSLIIKGKYNGEDPEELIKEAEKVIGKWMNGKQITKPDCNHSLLSNNHHKELSERLLE